MSEQRKPVTFTIKSDLHNILQKISKDTRIPMSRLMDEAIQDLDFKYKKNKAIKESNEGANKNDIQNN